MTEITKTDINISFSRFTNVIDLQTESNYKISNIKSGAYEQYLMNMYLLYLDNTGK